MKKLIASAVIGSALLVAPFAVFADDATSTNVVLGGGHRRPEMAGWVDSINNKGPWLLKNMNGGSNLFYISEHSELRADWQAVITAFYK